MAAILKIKKSQHMYLQNYLANFNKILHAVLQSLAAVQKFKFKKSKMADGRHFKNVICDIYAAI